jgi:hypothetical protein
MGKATTGNKGSTTTANSSKHSKKSSTQIRAKPVLKSASSNTKNGTIEVLSRGQRKRLAKRQQYQARQSLIQSSLQLDTVPLGVKTLQNAIDGVNTQTNSNSNNDNNNSNNGAAVRIKTTHQATRWRLQESAMKHVGLVLQHPVFEQDPFQALQLHLKHTLPNSAAKDEINHNKKKKKSRRR